MSSQVRRGLEAGRETGEPISRGRPTDQEVG